MEWSKSVAVGEIVARISVLRSLLPSDFNLPMLLGEAGPQDLDKRLLLRSLSSRLGETARAVGHSGRLLPRKLSMGTEALLQKALESPTSQPSVP